MKHLLNITLVSFLLLGCFQKHTQTNEKLSEKTNKNGSEPRSIVDTVSSSNNQLVINKRSIIILYPDVNLKNKLIKKIGEENFNEVLNDNTFYYSEVFKLLDTLGEKYQTTESSTITFQKSDNTLFKVNREEGEVYWGVYLFDGKSNPKLADITDFKQSYDSYFNQ